jgi:hypothetical protein
VALRGRGAPGHRSDYPLLSFACTSRRVKGAALVGGMGHPLCRSGERQVLVRVGHQ